MRKKKMNNFNLMYGDCLQLMKQIPDGSVDLVLTDPPYNISKENNFDTMGRSGIDFGEWDKSADIFSYIAECYRILNKNGSFIVFNDWKNLGDIVKFSEKLGFITKDMLRLEKTNPMPRNRDRRYITDFECAIWFTMPNSKWIFNRLDDKYQRPKFCHSIDKGFHPTQKSLKLMEDIIKIHSNSQQVICDPFMGSGTTGVACKNLNRKFIGIEKDDKYFEIAKKRIEEA
jgi:site-specific DNA-methyltransferase (adenine-specific)